MVGIGNRERLPCKAIFIYDVCCFDLPRNCRAALSLPFLYNILEGREERLCRQGNCTYEVASEREMARSSIAANPCPGAR